jgi:hypothetical protein
LPFLELTQEQEKIVKPQLDRALEASKDDEKGAVLAQIYETNDGRVLCHCGFIPPSLAKQLFTIMEKFWAEETT